MFFCCFSFVSRFTERSDECQCYCKGGDGVIRADSKGRAVVAPECISLSCSRAVLSLSSAENVSGHDRAVWLKSEHWVLFGFLLTSVGFVFAYCKQS